MLPHPQAFEFFDQVVLLAHGAVTRRAPQGGVGGGRIFVIMVDEGIARI